MSLVPNLDLMTDDEKLAALESIHASINQSKEIQKKKIAENVQLVLQALKRIESDMLDRVNGTVQTIENRVKSIKDGKDGINGRDGKDGKDGRPGKDGKDGRNGRDGLQGLPGADGQDGVGVSDAHIDFDGSLIITLTNGNQINVGEVVAPDLAESIKVISNGGGTSQEVLNTLASLQTQINNLIPSQTGNSGKFLTTNGSTLSWAQVAGGLNYQGTWNASTNTPTLTSGTGSSGYYYIVGTAGSTNLDGITDWQIGDWLVFNGTAWQKLDQTNLVTSVAGRTGAITLTSTDVGLGNVENKSSATIRGEITSGNVTTALGYTPLNPTTSQTANTVYAAPNGTAGAPTFRAIVAADIPTLNQNTTGTAANITASSNTTLTSLANLATVGTLTSGTWNATTIATNKGGTGLTSFTANGVVYASSTSALTTGSALTFDGTNLGVGGSATQTSTGRTVISANGSSAALMNLNVAGTSKAYWFFDGSNTTFATTSGYLTIDPAGTTTIFNIAGSEQMRLTSTGLGIGTSSPSKKLDVNGDALIYGVTVGRGAGAVSTNTAVGASALAANTSGADNSAFGRVALNANTTGNENTAIGEYTLQNNTSGNVNTAVGVAALATNTTGSYNVAVGQRALNSNTTASNNTAVGYQAGYSNTTGTYNSYVGYQAGYTNSISNGNSGFGYGVLTYNTGANNTAVGFFASLYNSTGANNTALGVSALQSNTTASNNTAVGYQAAYSNTTGQYNTVFGYKAGYSNTTSAGSCYIGDSTGINATGLGNTFVGGSGSGAGCGSAVTSGAKNTILGSYTGNQGGLDIRTANNYIVLSDGDGNPRQVIDSSGNVGIGTTSPGTRLQIGNPSDSNQALRFDFSDSSTARINSTRVGSGNFQSLLLAGQDTLQFYTNGSERARIDSSGNLLVGTTTVGNSSKQTVDCTSTNGIAVVDTGNTNGRTYLTFISNGATTGSVSRVGTTSAVAYNTSSDYRLKENIQPMTGALAKVAALKPCTYNWKSDGSEGEGFIAHELAEVCPNAVTGEKDAVNEDGSIKPQGIDTSFLVATLTAAIKEQQALIESLTTRIAALEGK